MTAVNVRYAAFLEKKYRYHPCRVQQARPAAHDTQIVILTLSLFFSLFLKKKFLFWRAGRLLCEHAGHAGPGVPLCFTLKNIEACCLIFSPFRHHPSASSSRRKVIANTHSFLRVCVRACVCMCVYIYIKRESNIYESIFSYFVMRAIDKKQKEDKVLFFFSSVGHCHIILKGSVYFLEKTKTKTRL